MMETEGSPAEAALPEDARPKVSVLMITYNHEKFLAQAIESALMQETNFPVELVIGEDCSTDRTRQIAQEYQARNPDRIRLLLPERNLGVKQNFVQTLRACQGEYLAILEGDDYWTDPRKLQRQADYLDAHPECPASLHNAGRLEEGDPCPQRLFCPEGRAPFITLEELMTDNPIPTASVVLRANAVRELPEWFYETNLGDWPLWIVTALHGPLAYSPEVMSVYRMHSGGMWIGESRIRRLQQEIEAITLFDAKTDFAHRKRTRPAIADRLETTMNLHIGAKDFVAARSCLSRMLRLMPLRTLLTRRYLFKRAVKVYVLSVLRPSQSTRTP